MKPYLRREGKGKERKGQDGKGMEEGRGGRQEYSQGNGVPSLSLLKVNAKIKSVVLHTVTEQLPPVAPLLLCSEDMGHT